VESFAPYCPDPSALNALTWLSLIFSNLDCGDVQKRPAGAGRSSDRRRNSLEREWFPTCSQVVDPTELQNCEMGTTAFGSGSMFGSGGKPHRLLAGGGCGNGIDPWLATKQKSPRSSRATATEFWTEVPCWSARLNYHRC